MAEHRQVAPATISSLIADLASKDGMTRVRARCVLVAIGDDSVRPLIDALSSKNQLVRWEAAKALSQIGSPAATDALVTALEDKLFDVRCLAAQGLINIEREAIMPVLRAVSERADSIWMREGAHHVPHDLPEESSTECYGPYWRRRKTWVPL